MHLARRLSWILLCHIHCLVETAGSPKTRFGQVQITLVYTLTYVICVCIWMHICQSTLYWLQRSIRRTLDVARSSSEPSIRAGIRTFTLSAPTSVGALQGLLLYNWSGSSRKTDGQGYRITGIACDLLALVEVMAHWRLVLGMFRDRCNINEQMRLYMYSCTYEFVSVGWFLVCFLVSYVSKMKPDWHQFGTKVGKKTKTASFLYQVDTKSCPTWYQFDTNKTDTWAKLKT